MAQVELANEQNDEVPSAPAPAPSPDPTPWPVMS